MENALKKMGKETGRGFGIANSIQWFHVRSCESPPIRVDMSVVNDGMTLICDL